MREAELQIAALKMVRTSSVQPMRQQSRLAELREINEAVEVEGEYAPGGEGDFFVPGHWRRPSEVDGREVSRPEAAMVVRRTRSQCVSTEAEEVSAAPAVNTYTSRSNSSASSPKNPRRSSRLDVRERTSLFEVGDHEVTQPLQVHKHGQTIQTERLANSNVDAADTEHKEEAEERSNREGTSNTTSKSGLDILNTKEGTSTQIIRALKDWVIDKRQEKNMIQSKMQQ
jgi:hypothetical protein